MDFEVDITIDLANAHRRIERALSKWSDGQRVFENRNFRKDVVIPLEEVLELEASCLYPACRGFVHDRQLDLLVAIQQDIREELANFENSVFVDHLRRLRDLFERHVAEHEACLAGLFSLVRRNDAIMASFRARSASFPAKTLERPTVQAAA